MKGHALDAADGNNLFNGKDDTALVIGHHHRNHGGIFSDGFMDLMDIQLSGAIHGNPSDLHTAFLKHLPIFDIGRVLDGRGDYMTFAGLGLQGAVEGGVVALSAATGENNFARFGIDQRRHLRAGVIDRFSYLVTEGIGAGRIAPLLGEKRQHRLHHLRCDPRGGVVVKIVNRTVAHGHNPHAARQQENGELNRVSSSKSKLFLVNITIHRYSPSLNPP